MPAGQFVMELSELYPPSSRYSSGKAKRSVRKYAAAIRENIAMPLMPNPHMPSRKRPKAASGAATPLVGQIVAAMQRDIDARRLLPGARVPSIRDLARRQLISRHSAVEAYDRLVAAGYLESRPGSGFYVAARARGAPDPEAGNRRRIYDVAWLIRQALEDGSDMLKV